MAAPVAGRQIPWIVLGKVHEAGYMRLCIMPLPQCQPPLAITGWRNLTPQQRSQGFTFLVFKDNVTASMQELTEYIFQGAKVEVTMEERMSNGNIKILWLVYPEGYDVDSIPAIF
ncbi:hypothetical protein F53441_4154 [Fusarium austroafricanum]|uniref:Uncharacterized protein n=1 Tax=Fusarium austroafricanum TaxID=2364996 RepID=A0A8H4KL19_9HYPO|nr:hypothetical protein F53441_4154 [Fusarium austroafricanum]